VPDIQPLRKAFEMGHPEMARLLISHGHEVNLVSDLHNALGNENALNLLEIVLDHSSEEELRDLRIAPFIRHGHIDVLKWVCGRVPDPLLFLNRQDGQNENEWPLHSAIKRVCWETPPEGAQELVAFMIENGAQVRPSDFVLAAGHLNDLSWLLPHVRDVDGHNESGQSPLCAAAHQGSVQACTQLIEAGADVHQKNTDGLTPFLCGLRHPDVLKQLAKAGASHRVKNPQGENALAHAIKDPLFLVHDFLRLSDFLESQFPQDWPALLEEPSFSGKKLLHVLSKRSVTNVMDLDRFKGVLRGMINAKDQEGLTPLMVASADTNGQVRFLLQAGADVHAKDNKGRTALMHAIETRNAPLTMQLLMAGANPNEANKQGQSPLEVAMAVSASNCVPALLAMGAQSHTDVRFFPPKKWNLLESIMGKHRLSHAINSGDLHFFQFVLGQHPNLSSDDVQAMQDQVHGSKHKSECMAMAQSQLAQFAIESAMEKTMGTPSKTPIKP